MITDGYKRLQMITRHLFHLKCGGHIRIGEVREEEREKLKKELKQEIMREIERESRKAVRKMTRKPPKPTFYDPDNDD